MSTTTTEQRVAAFRHTPAESTGFGSFDCTSRDAAMRRAERFALWARGRIEELDGGQWVIGPIGERVYVGGRVLRSYEAV